MDGESESWWRTSRGEQVARKGNATLRSLFCGEQDVGGVEGQVFRRRAHRGLVDMIFERYQRS